MRFVIESAGAVSSRVRLSTHELVFDQSDPKLHGEDRGPSPLDAMVASIGACAHYYAAAFLVARKLDPSELTVSIHAEKSRDPSPHLDEIEVEVRLPPGLRADYQTSIERAIRQCPALGTLLHPPRVALRINAVAQGAA